VITHHPEGVGNDPPAIARVQLAKRSIVAAARGGDETIITVDRRYT
jgi:hypothetical protein